MFFDSSAYIVFLIAVTLLYWRLGFRPQNYFLLAASYFFYGWWDWRFLFLMGASTLGDFVVARALERSNDERHRRALLVLSLVMNFAALGFFKYCNFFVESFVEIAATLGMKNIPVS